MYLKNEPPQDTVEAENCEQRYKCGILIAYKHFECLCKRLCTSITKYLPPTSQAWLVSKVALYK